MTAWWRSFIPTSALLFPWEHQLVAFCLFVCFSWYRGIELSTLCLSSRRLCTELNPWPINQYLQKQNDTVFSNSNGRLRKKKIPGQQNKLTISWISAFCELSENSNVLENSRIFPTVCSWKYVILMILNPLLTAYLSGLQALSHSGCPSRRLQCGGGGQSGQPWRTIKQWRRQGGKQGGPGDTAHLP